MQSVKRKTFIGQQLYHINEHDQSITEGRVDAIFPHDMARVSWNDGRIVYQYGRNDAIWYDIILNCPRN